MPTASPLSTVVTSFSDGNDLSLLAMVPETAAIVAQTVKEDKADPSEEEEEDSTDPTDPETDPVDLAADPAADPAADSADPAADPADPATELEQLRAELAELKAAPAAAAAALAPSAESPLAHITSGEQIAAFSTQCDDTLEWVADNPDGGEVPDALAAVLLGRKIEDITEPLMLDREQTRALRKRAQSMLKDHLPQRLNHIKIEAATLEVIRKEAPEILDPAKPLGKLCAGILQEIPQLRAFPQWPALLRDWARGYTARVADEAKVGKQGVPPAQNPPPRTATTAAGRTVPLAPATSAGGARPAAAPALNAATRAAQKRISAGRGTEADHIAMLKLTE